MSFSGMDIVAVDQLAGQLAGQAAALNSSIGTIDGTVSALRDVWAGEDLEAFTAGWQQGQRAKALATVSALSSWAADLHKQIEQQMHASGNPQDALPGAGQPSHGGGFFGGLLRDVDKAGTAAYKFVDHALTDAAQAEVTELDDHWKAIRTGLEVAGMVAGVVALGALAATGVGAPFAAAIFTGATVAEAGSNVLMAEGDYVVGSSSDPNKTQRDYADEHKLEDTVGAVVSVGTLGLGDRIPGADDIVEGTVTAVSDDAGADVTAQITEAEVEHPVIAPVVNQVGDNIRDDFITSGAERAVQTVGQVLTGLDGSGSGNSGGAPTAGQVLSGGLGAGLSGPMSHLVEQPATQQRSILLPMPNSPLAV